MKGFYSNKKKFYNQEKNQISSGKISNEISISTNSDENQKIVKNKHDELLEAQKRLKIIEKQEKNSYRSRKVHEITSENQSFSEKSNKKINFIEGLDLNLNSRIPRPINKKKNHEKLNEEVSKIPKITSLHKISDSTTKNSNLLQNLPWKKGDLLDSLDLGITNLKKFFKNQPKICESPTNSIKESNWLKENFRESINEWAPKRISGMDLEKPNKRKVCDLNSEIKKLKINQENSELSKDIPNSLPEMICDSNNFTQNYEENSGCIDNEEKKTEKTNELNQNGVIEPKPPNNNIKPIDTGKRDQNQGTIKAKILLKKSLKKITPKPNPEVLNNKLWQVEEEEIKLQESLARLDLKALKAKNQANLIELDIQVKQIQANLINCKDSASIESFWL